MIFQLALFEPCKCSFKHHTLLCEEDSIISWILLYSEVFQQHSMGEIYTITRQVYQDTICEISLQ